MQQPELKILNLSTDFLLYRLISLYALTPPMDNAKRLPYSSCTMDGISIGRQVEELVAGTVQADLPELADLGRHVQTFRHGLLPFFRAPVGADSLAPLRVRRYC